MSVMVSDPSNSWSWSVMDEFQTDFGFSFDAIPTIDTVKWRWTKEERGDWRAGIQVEQAKLIFELWR